MKTVALIATVLPLLAQALNPSLRELLEVTRPLTISEIAAVLNASREALTAKTFRLSSVPGGQGPEVLMGPAAQPRIVRITDAIEGGIVGGVSGSSSRPTETRWREDVIDIIEYTGRPARDCDASAEQGEMVIEYRFRSSTQAWTVTARRGGPRDVGWISVGPAFEMLRGAGPVTSGERREIGGRWARAVVSPWTPPPEDPRSEPSFLTGDPMPNAVGVRAPNDAVQSLWIDTESLLPLRWEVSKRASVVYRFDFTYEAIDLRLPESVDVPQCIR